jgi:hypothetical protein
LAGTGKSLFCSGNQVCKIEMGLDVCCRPLVCNNCIALHHGVKPLFLKTMMVRRPRRIDSLLSVRLFLVILVAMTYKSTELVFRSTTAWKSGALSLSRPSRQRTPLCYQRSFCRSTILRASVTGTVYSSDDSNDPIVRLYTKEGCTLCDKTKDVLASLRSSHPHT